MPLAVRTAASLAALVSAAVHAGEPVPGGRVIELFTSHGCSSCPSAERLLGDMLEAEPSLVALEYHVDYWNSLVHGADGSFADPFSDAAWSLRQRGYDALALDGRRGVYTPQTIVDGRVAAVGSDGRSIARALEAGRADTPLIDVERRGGEIVVRVADVADGGRRDRDAPPPVPTPAPGVGEVALVRFLERATTPVTGGENRGLELVNHRIVVAIEPLGRVGADGALTATVAAPADRAHGCAVLVRYAGDASRLTGRLCPAPA